MDAKQTWAAELPSELAFWKSIIDGTHPDKDWVASFDRRLRGADEFQGHLTRYLVSNGTTRILDVGAGPVTSLSRPSGHRVEIVAVDPLTDAYNALLDTHMRLPFTRTLKGDGETLSSLGLGQFDIVYSRNALDHSYDPVRAIDEMTEVCREGGVVFIEGHINEALTGGYEGLHQWNFMPCDGDLIIWNKANEATSLRARVKADVMATNHGQRWFSAVITSTSL